MGQGKNLALAGVVGNIEHRDSLIAERLDRGRSGSQAGQGDRDQPVDRGFGWQAERCSEGMEAVARQLAGRDVVPYMAGPGSLFHELFDEIAEVLLGPGDVLAPM